MFVPRGSRQDIAEGCSRASHIRHADSPDIAFVLLGRSLIGEPRKGPALGPCASDAAAASVLRGRPCPTEDLRRNRGLWRCCGVGQSGASATRSAARKPTPRGRTAVQRHYDPVMRGDSPSCTRRDRFGARSCLVFMTGASAARDPPSRRGPLFCVERSRRTGRPANFHSPLGWSAALLLRWDQGA